MKKLWARTLAVLIAVVVLVAIPISASAQSADNNLDELMQRVTKTNPEIIVEPWDGTPAQQNAAPLTEVVARGDNFPGDSSYYAWDLFDEPYVTDFDGIRNYVYTSKYFNTESWWSPQYQYVNIHAYLTSGECDVKVTMYEKVFDPGSSYAVDSVTVPSGQGWKLTFPTDDIDYTFYKVELINKDVSSATVDDSTLEIYLDGNKP